MQISFPTLDPFVMTDMKADEGPAQIDGAGHLFLPSGPSARRPAVVILEGLGGIKESRELAYGRRLADRGVVAMAVDTFGARGAADLSHPRRAIEVTESMMLADAFGALRFLSDHPAVDPAKVMVMGFSYGGMVTMLTAYEQIAALFATGNQRFAGHVAYYGCSVARLEDSTATGAPVLIMNGGLDRNVSVERVGEIADDLRRGGTEVEHVVFEDAYHQWDSDDVERRFVQHSLRDCRVIVDRDYVIRDEGTGLPFTGKIGRTLGIAARVSFSGYHIQRHDEIFAQSDARLFRFIDRIAGRSGATETAGTQGIPAGEAGAERKVHVGG